MKKYMLLVFALFGMLAIGSCNDDEPVVPLHRVKKLKFRSRQHRYWYRHYTLILAPKRMGGGA